MKNNVLIRACLLFCVAMGLIATMMFVAGCDTDGEPGTDGINSFFDSHPYVSDPRQPGAPRDIVVTPAEAEVEFVGQEIVFTAKGGDGPFNWEVSNSSFGSIRSSAWSQGIYTASRVAANNVIVYDSVGHAGIANIIVGENTTNVYVSVAVSPSSATLTAMDDKVTLRAFGGRPPYTWTVEHVSLGNINQSSGNAVVYTRYSSGDNAVRVTDSNGDTDYAVINQP